MPREFAFPGTTKRFAPDRSCEVQHYRIQLDLDVPNKSLAATCSLRISALGKACSSFELDAIELNILRVHSAQRELSFSHDGRRLRVELLDALPLGEVATIDIDYTATPRRGLYFVGPDQHYPDKPLQVWTQGQDEDSRYWFPCFDSPHQKATSEVIVTVPEGWYALSNGVLMSDSCEDTRRTMHWRLDVPHSCYLITLAAAQFEIIQHNWNEVEVSYHVQPERREDCLRTLHRTPEMLEVFSEVFGVRYPFNKYAQVFVADFIFGGMENTTATSLTDSVLLDERAAIDFDAESLVCHELAHQWFGDLLTCRDWGEGWLNEGFATYSEYLWRHHSEGRDAAALTLAAFSEAYLAEDKGRYRRTIVTKEYEAPLDIFDRHLYDKAGRVVHMLRCVLGDADFFKSVRHYLEAHRGASVETRDLARSIDDATGRCLDWFFDQWLLTGDGHPEIHAEFNWQHTAKVLSVQVTQTQDTSGNTPVFRMPSHVRLVVDGVTTDHAIELCDASHGFTFACMSEPEQAIFDPGKHILGELKSSKTPAMWLSQLSDAEEGIDRIVAAQECARIGGKKVEDALAHSLEHDQFWGVCAEAARSLGTLQVPSARDTLIEALREASHPKVRRAVAAALGRFRYDSMAATALLQVTQEGDPSYFVEAEAYLALGKTRDDRAYKALSGGLTKDSFIDVIRQHIYQGLAELQDDRCFALLLGGCAYGMESFGRRAAMRAMAAMASERKDHLTRQCRERLIELLHDPDFRVQGQAIASLDALGDKAAIAALDALVREGFDNRLKRRAQEATRNLSEGRSEQEQLTALRAQGEQFQKQIRQLQSQVDVMQSEARRDTLATTSSESAAVPRQLRRKGGKKTIPA